MSSYSVKSTLLGIVRTITQTRYAVTLARLHESVEEYCVETGTATTRYAKK